MDGFDVVMEGTTEPGEAAAERVAGWEAAGATWWMEANWAVEANDALESSRDRLRAGPPRPAG